MIRMIQSMSAENSKAYFSDSLLQAEYYMDEQELPGSFHGKLAVRLSLGSAVNKEDFYALCENRNPIAGGNITPKTKEERTVSYDINFHVPKSVSIVEFLSGDNRITEAFEESVHKTMQEIEADSRVRVRKGGQDYDRPSGELAWATFVHKTSRPVDGSTPDPHLHAHCIAFNMSYDEIENTYKACQFREIQRGMPYYQALYHKHFSDALMKLGYGIRRTPTAFELEGIPEKAIDLFSKRKESIEELAQEKGIINPKELAALGAKTRARKNKELTLSQLKANWKQQILDHGLDKIHPEAIIRKDKQRIGRWVTVEQSIAHSLQHNFARASVVPVKQVLREALRYSLGTPETKADDLKLSLSSNREVIAMDEGAQTMCTTREVLREEREMVELARQCTASLPPLYRNAPPLNLKDQQAKAVKQVLTTTDRLSIIHGAAGSGKTTLMNEAIRKIRQSGKEVVVLAPSSDAARDVLRNSGFKDAETVALFLVDERLQQQAANGVVWVDEAGLLGTTDAKRLLEVTKEYNARLILGGDPKQHNAVARGDALRVLQKYGGIKPAEVNRIFRQQKQEYRDAIRDLAIGRTTAAIEKLEKIGAIKETDPTTLNRQLADDYLSTIKAGRSALVICPTHEQGRKVTEHIRAALKAAQKLGRKDHMVKKYESLNYTEAQKRDVQSYTEGQWVRFNQHVKGVRKASMWQVEQNANDKILLKSIEGKTAHLPLDQPSRFDVMEQTSIPLAKGDRIRVTQNCFDLDNKRLNNGSLLEVTSIGKDGRIKFINTTSNYRYSLNKTFGHITHAHCITSHASQGKTVDEVLIAQPSSTFAAANAKQFYVSASRGKQHARFYTNDKAGLIDHVSKLGERQSALEFASEKTWSHIDYVREHQRTEYDKGNRMNTDREKGTVKEKNYEPEL